MADIQYTQLDPQSRLMVVQNRIRDLEMQYQQIQLRVEAPDVNNPLNVADPQNLQKLANSLEVLRNMEEKINAEINPPAQKDTPANTPAGS